MTKRGVSNGLYIAVIIACEIVVTIALWLVCSAVESFVFLEWRAITSTTAGRWIFAVIWIWLLFRIPSKKQVKL